MIMPRHGLILCVCLVLLSIWLPLAARVAARTEFTSARYGYSLTLAPGWSVQLGDCAPYSAFVTRDKINSMEIHPIPGIRTPGDLRQAERRMILAHGRVLSTISFNLLHLPAMTFRTARGTIRDNGRTFGILVAGTVYNGLTFMIVAITREPSGNADFATAGQVQNMLASLAFHPLPRIGSAACAGSGPRQGVTGKQTVKTTQITIVRQNATEMPAGASFLAPPGLSVAAATALSRSAVPPLRAAAAVSASGGVPASIPTSGVTSNGCAITPDTAAGEAYLLGLLDTDRASDSYYTHAVPFTLSDTLSAAARDHSCDMALQNNQTHYGSDGSSPWQRITAMGITWTTGGENIGEASGYNYGGVTAGIQHLNNAMMAEPLTENNHRWNIMNPALHRVGIGIIEVNHLAWITEDMAD